MSSGPFVIRGILINGKGDGQTISPRRLAEILPLLRLGHDDEEVINLNEQVHERPMVANTTEPNNDMELEDSLENNDDHIIDAEMFNTNSTSEIRNIGWIMSSSDSDNSTNTSYMSYSLNRSSSSSNNFSSHIFYRPETPPSPTVFEDSDSLPMPPINFSENNET